MANRVIVGKRGSDYGLFVSKSGVDVTASSSTTPLSFDSNAANGLNVHSYGQGILVPDAPANASYSFGGVTYTSHEATITHNLGYTPAYAVRWCTASEISSGVATAVWSPSTIAVLTVEVEENESGDDETQEYEENGGLSIYAPNTNTLKLTNYFIASDITASTSSINSNGSAVIFYSYVIFHTENFLNGESL